MSIVTRSGSDVNTPERSGARNILKRLTDKVAIVTGSGAGIGQGGALRLAQEGAHVAVLEIEKDAAEKTLALIQEAGGEGIFVQTDVGQESQCRQAVDVVLERWGRLDVLAISQ